MKLYGIIDRSPQIPSGPSAQYQYTQQQQIQYPQTQRSPPQQYRIGIKELLGGKFNGGQNFQANMQIANKNSLPNDDIEPSSFDSEETDRDSINYDNFMPPINKQTDSASQYKQNNDRENKAQRAPLPPRQDDRLRTEGKQMKQGHLDSKISASYENQYSQIPTSVGQKNKQKGRDNIFFNKSNYQSTEGTIYKRNSAHHLQLPRSSSRNKTNISKESTHYSLKNNPRVNPEKHKDFNKAYISLIKKMYNEQGQQISGLLTEDELEKVEHYQSISERGFIERSKQFETQKKEKIAAKQFEAANKKDDDCTFSPRKYSQTIKKSQQRQKPRDLQQFLLDQNQYVQNKKMNSQRMIEKIQSIERQELKKQPQIDELSKQIVEMMDERKIETAYDRLYKIGKEKLRNQTIEQQTPTARNQSQQNQQNDDEKSLKIKKDQIEKEKNLIKNKIFVQKRTNKDLYELYQEKLSSIELKRQEQYDSLKQRANKKVCNQQSEECLIQAFKREFKAKLVNQFEIYDVINMRRCMTSMSASDENNNLSLNNQQQVGQSKLDQINLRNSSLTFQQVVQQMEDMSFLKSSEIRSEAENKELLDLYTIFKCDQQQSILAENLQNILMVISGIRDKNIEITNDIDNLKWYLSGVYEEQSGILFLREGEHYVLQQHFKEMSLNRLQFKRTAKEFSRKKIDIQFNFEPKILEKSKILAEKSRLKMASRMNNDSVEQIQTSKLDIVQILLNPEIKKEKEDKILNIRSEIQHKINQDITFRPKINKKIMKAVKQQFMNIKGKIDSNHNHYTSGDKNLDLYLMAKAKQQKILEQQDSLFDREENECIFKPQININQVGYLHNQKSLKQIKGMGQALGRMKKGRFDAEVKKKMTERSNQSYANYKKAKKVIKMINKHQYLNEIGQYESGSFNHQINRKFKSGFGIDGAQIVPSKNSNYYSNVERAPLHLPKQEPKLKKTTVQDLIEKENELMMNTIGGQYRTASRSNKRKSKQDQLNGEQNNLQNLQSPQNNQNVDKSDNQNIQIPGLQLENENNDDSNQQNQNEFKQNINQAQVQIDQQENRESQKRVQQKKEKKEEIEQEDSSLLVDQQIQKYMPDDQEEQQKIKNQESKRNSQNQTIQEKQLNQNQIPDPKLYVDVNIGKQGMERIIVYEGDTAEGLSKEFCEKNGLNKEMEEKLRMLLEQQIAGVLPKIIEDNANESEDEESENFANLNKRNELKDKDELKSLRDQHVQGTNRQSSSSNQNFAKQNENSKVKDYISQENQFIDKKTSEKYQELQEDNLNEGENEEEPQINEELYTSIMDSIERVWQTFDQEEGLLGKTEFQDIMIKIARDQKLFDDDNQQLSQQQLEQNKLFFTPENLESIYYQIKQQEQEHSQQELGNRDLISHSTVVDVLYNVLIQIKGVN